MEKLLMASFELTCLQHYISGMLQLIEDLREGNKPDVDEGTLVLWRKALKELNEYMRLIIILRKQEQDGLLGKYFDDLVE
jgi:hypothetical protein